MPSVSFVITVYNKARYLPKMLESLGNQGDFECEYIFINDGSTDNSVDIIESITKKWQNVLIIDQDNSGYELALHAGIQNSHGDYVKFLNSDDILLPKATEYMLNLMEKHDAKFAFGKNLDMVDANFEIPDLNISGHKLIMDSLKSLLLDEYPGISSISKSNSMANRKVIAKIISPDERKIDFAFFTSLKAASNHQFLYVNGYVSGSVPASKSKDSIEPVLLSLKYFLAENRNIENRYRNLIIARAYKNLMKGASGDVRRKYLFQYWKYRYLGGIKNSKHAMNLLENMLDQYPA